MLTGQTGAAERPEPELFGHPRGLTFLFTTEMWERFSYYGMRAILIYYLVNYLLHPDVFNGVIGHGMLRGVVEFIFNGGQHMDTQPFSSGIYGLYTALVYLTPLIGGLIADGRVSGPGRPWLGVNAEELHGRLFVGRVTPGGPAEKAGIRRGDLIVGVDGAQPTSLADFYRKVWAVGGAGASVPLDVLQDSQVRRIDVKSMNRLDHLKLRSTF